MKRDYPDRPIVGVGGVIVDHERVLVVKRATEPRRGQWSIPGGAVEIGETLREALAREVQEETGLLIEVADVLEVLDSIVRDSDGRAQYHYVLVDFTCRRVGGQLRAGTDASDARWITLNELHELEIAEATQRVIRKALAMTTVAVQPTR